MNIQEFEAAVQSPLFAYTREWRTSQYSDQYFVQVYHKDPESPTGVAGQGSLPRHEAVQVLTSLGKDMPRASRV